jgi:hypothetical protein
MVAVVITGCAIGWLQIERRREDLVYRADWYRIIAYTWKARQAAAPNDRNAARFIAYFESLASKYQHAAHYPWLPTAPDPPVPKLIRSGASNEQ